MFKETVEQSRLHSERGSGSQSGWRFTAPDTGGCVRACGTRGLTAHLFAFSTEKKNAHGRVQNA